LSEEKEVELLKSMLVQRPSDILNIHKELFTIFDRALIFKPMYRVSFVNTKTKKEAMLQIDAITGKTKIGDRPALAHEKETVKESEKLASREETPLSKLFSLPEEKI
jgi:hypothetical protein